MAPPVEPDYLLSHVGNLENSLGWCKKQASCRACVASWPSPSDDSETRSVIESAFGVPVKTT